MVSELQWHLEKSPCACSSQARAAEVHDIARISGAQKWKTFVAVVDHSEVVLLEVSTPSVTDIGRARRRK